MAITFVDDAVADITSPFAPALPDHAPGDMLFLMVWQNNGTSTPPTVTTPSNYVLVQSEIHDPGSTDAARLTVFKREATGTNENVGDSPGTVTVSSSTNTFMRMVAFAKDAGMEWDVSSAYGDLPVGGGSLWDITSASSVSVQAGDVLVAAAGIENNSAATWSSELIFASTGSYTYGTTTNIFQQSVTANASARVSYRAVSTGSATTTTVEHTASLSSSRSGGTMFLRLREVSSSTPKNSTDTGAGTEAESSLTVAATSNEPAGRAEAETLAVTITSADTSSTVENQSVSEEGATAKADAETRPAAESQSLAVEVSSSDTASAVEAVSTSRDLADADSAQALEEQELRGPADSPFPAIFVEVAFSNDTDETMYATTGWSEITDFVRRIEGDLRGRQYEINRTEAGTVTVELDNSDLRFTPGSELSPYSPNVKPNRRLRVRGKNMVDPNVARGGGADHNALGFDTPDWDPSFAAGVSAPVWSTHAEDLLPAIGPDHVEATVEAGQSSWHRVIDWLGPLELGARLANSAYVWLIDGTEPAGTEGRFEIFYFDNDGNEVLAELRPQVIWNGTSTVPSRKAFSATPPGTAKYARIVLALFYPTPTTVPVTYAITGVQTELPVNLAADISGQYDAIQWQMKGGTEVAVRYPADSAIETVWVDSESMFQVIPHLVPGETYSVAVEAYKTPGTDIMMTADDGLSGELLEADNTWTPLRTVFVADSIDQAVQFIPETITPGQTLRVRGLHVERTDADLDPAPSNEIGETDWEAPIDIFEGWVERWPWLVAEPFITITVVDRLKRMGAIELSSTIRETLIQDSPGMIVPFADEPELNPTAAAWLGTWAEEADAASVSFVSTRGDISTTGWEFGVEGPTEESAIDFNPLAPANEQGWYLVVPYSKDYVAPPPPTAPPPKPKPPATTVRTYQKNYYATWSRSFEGDNTTRWDDSPYLYQGNSPDGSLGNQKALVGFNWKAIMSDLKGASITGVWFTLQNHHARWNRGLTLFLGTHSYSSKPGSWSGGTVKENRWRPFFGEGQRRTVNVGIPVGNEFKSGSARGIAVGPCGTDCSDNYGYWRGATQGGKPYITIQFKK